MNQKTSKLIKRFYPGEPHKAENMKRLWNKTPRPMRHELRKYLQTWRLIPGNLPPK